MSADALGPASILVNNAGTDQFGFFQDTDEDLWQRIVDINLIGVLRTTHAVLPGMIERGGGRIVNVASEAGRVGSSGSAAYSAAKGGVIAFTKTIAREGARHGVLCNAVAPGPIDTPLLNRAPAEMGELGQKVVDTMVRSTVLRRLGAPEEVAATIAFLFTRDMRKLGIISWVSGAVASLLGLWLSYAFDLPTGPMIVCAYGLVLIAAGLVRRAGVGAAVET